MPAGVLVGGRERGRLLAAHRRPAAAGCAESRSTSSSRRTGLALAFAFSSPTEPNRGLGLRPRFGEHAEADRPRRCRGRHREPELHRFESFDGESIPVFLFLPAGEGPFPVVVTVHGGPESQWRAVVHVGLRRRSTQYLVARGYAVAAPNVRGSSGYGKRFEHLDDVEKRLDSVRDLASLHEWLVGAAGDRRLARRGVRALVRRLHGARRARVPAGALGGGHRVRGHLEPPSRSSRTRRVPAPRGPRAGVRAARDDPSPARAPVAVERTGRDQGAALHRARRNDPRVPVGESEADRTACCRAGHALRARDLRGRGAHGREAREPRGLFSGPPPSSTRCSSRPRWRRYDGRRAAPWPSG